MSGDDEVFYDKIIVSCAVVVDKNNHVLVQSVKDDKKIDGLWEFPGGKVRHKQSIINELIREVEEEVNITLTKDSIKPITFNVFKDKKGFEFLVMFFLCKKWRGNLKANENQDMLWVDIQNIQTLPFLSQNKKVIKDIVRFLQKG